MGTYRSMEDIKQNLEGTRSERLKEKIREEYCMKDRSEEANKER